MLVVTAKHAIVRKAIDERQQRIEIARGRTLPNRNLAARIQFVDRFVQRDTLVVG